MPGGKSWIPANWDLPPGLAAGSVLGFYVFGVWSGTFSADLSLPAVLSLLTITVPSGAGLLILCRRTPESRRIALFLFGFSCAILAASCLRFAYDAETAGAYSGLARERSVGFLCECTDDSRTLSDGRTLHTARLISVTGADGTVASARGKVLIFAEGGDSAEPTSWGGRYFFAAGLSAAKDEPGLWFSYSGTRAPRAEGWRAALFRYRAAVRSVFLQKIRLMPAGGFFSALFLGDRDDFPAEVYASFLRAGAVHILALSGMHLGLVSLVLSFFLVPLLGRRNAFWFSASILLFYVFLAGPKPSLIRAALMFLCVGISRFLRRNVGSLSVLSLVFVVYLFFDPEAASALSFQFSFLSVAGIIVFSPVVASLGYGLVPRPLLLALSVSVSAQLATFPLSLAVFGEWRPVGVLSGLFLGPLIALFLWLGMACFVLTFFLPWGAGLLSKGLQFFNDLTIVVVEQFGRFPPVRISDNLQLVLWSAAAGLLVLVPPLRVFLRKRMEGRSSVQRKPVECEEEIQKAA